MHCATKFCYIFGKTDPKIVKLLNETYKDKCFSESMIFRWYDDLKKNRLSAEPAPKPWPIRKCCELWKY